MSRPVILLLNVNCTSLFPRNLRNQLLVNDKITASLSCTADMSPKRYIQRYKQQKWPLEKMLGSNIFFKKSKISIRFNLPKVCLSIRVSFCICRVIYTLFQCFAVTVKKFLGISNTQYFSWSSWTPTSWRISKLEKNQYPCSQKHTLDIKNPYNLLIFRKISKFYKWKAKITSKTQQINLTVNCQNWQNELTTFKGTTRLRHSRMFQWARTLIYLYSHSKS